MVASVAVLSDVHGALPALEAVLAVSAYPGARAWADAYARTVHSDAEALTVFAPRAGQAPRTH